MWPYWLKFFVPGPAGDSEKPGWAAARARAYRRQGQMGQQMGKEAEPPLICSTENPESGHTQKREEEGEGQKEKRSCFIQSPQTYLTLPPTEQPKRSLELIYTLLLNPTTFFFFFFTAAWENKYCLKSTYWYERNEKMTAWLSDLFLCITVDVLHYLPSLISSIKARPAFFWMEFCHSWKETICDR